MSDTRLFCCKAVACICLLIALFGLLCFGCRFVAIIRIDRFPFIPACCYWAVISSRLCKVVEQKMCFYRTPKPLENPPTPKPPVPFVSEFEKIERRHFEDNPPPLTPSEGKAFSKKIKKSHNPFFLLLRIFRRLRFRQDLRAVLDAKYERMHKRVKKQSRYKTKKPDLRTILERYDKKPAIAGNISYKDMVNSQGENLRVQLSLSAVPKLYAYPFFFSARIYREYAIVTIKKRDKENILYNWKNK